MKKIIYVVSALVLIVAAIASFYAYTHHCKHQLREVDRYALPTVISFMKALSDWELEKLRPYLSNEYISARSKDEWASVLKELSVLGELKSFARPNFVSHTPYLRYKLWPSSVDMYSVASEFENDNAVVRIFFDNNCGKLKISSFVVTSKSIVTTPDYLEEIQDDGKSDEILDNLNEEELDDDLDSLYEKQQEETPIDELEENVSSTIKEKVTEQKTKQHGKAYRY